MKATELMIGDWVKIFDYIHPRQVDIIDMHSIRVSEYHYPNCHTITAAHNCPESEITPIPLTAEILEKNPKVKDIGYWDKFGEYRVFRLYLIPVVNLWYVNQLQHALRLCGLNELADNFKI